MAGNITITLYLNKERHKKYEEDKTKYNDIARNAMRDALDVATTVIEEDLLDVAQKEIEQEKKEKEQLKDIIEEKSIPIKEKKFSIKNFFKTDKLTKANE